MVRERHRWAALLLVGLVAFTTRVDGQAGLRASAVDTNLSSTLEKVVASAGPAVVEIFATSYTPAEGQVARTADLVTTERASGSGVIVDGEGYIVTNAHVVRTAQRLRVELPVRPDGDSILSNRSRILPARLIGLDLETDLAVIKVDAKELPSLTFGDSDALRAGQVVLAFGSPLGLHNSVSLGVVSAVARQMEPESPMIYVQTDASIGPGSSGGPLMDLQGRIVGINTLIVSRSGGYEGLGFAAPGNIVRTVYEQIRQHGRVRRGDIGARAQTITPLMAAGLGLPRDHGVILSDVKPGGAAAFAGLRPGDLVLTLDGKPMENGRQFQVNLYRHYVGDVITLDILREGRVMKMPIAMGEREHTITALSGTVDPREHLVARLGVLGLDLTPQIAQYLPALRVREGVVVASTVAGAIDSREGGLAAGDVVHAVNRTPVNGLLALRAALASLKAGDPVVLQVDRQGELIYLTFLID